MKKEIFTEKSKLLQLGIVVVLISGVFLANGCSLKEKNGKNNQSGVSHPCPKEALKKYIESRIKGRTEDLTCFGLTHGWVELAETGDKISGYKVNFIGKPRRCHKGKKEGENINYTYVFYPASYPFSIKKKVTSEEGEIKEVIKWDITEVVIDPKPTAEVVSIKCGK